MSQNPDGQQQWQQPNWSAAPAPDAEQDRPAWNSGDGGAEAVSGVVVPVSPPPPPSVIESGLRVVSGIAWPVAIVLALLGYGGWVLNIAGAILVTALFGNIATEMKRRRKGRQ